MKNTVLVTTLLALLLAGPSPAIAEDLQLKADVPERYTVKRGDTLWDISAVFLQSPWLWPEIWLANQQIENPSDLSW